MLIGIGLVLAGLLAVALLLFGVATLIGTRLPVAHQARRSVELPAGLEHVWEQVADPTWARGDTTFETVEAVRPTRLVRRVVGETAFGGRWTLELQPVDGASTRLTVTEDGEVYNVFFRFMSRYVIGHARGIDAYMAALRRRLTGEK